MLNIDQVFRDGVASRRGFGCQFSKTPHLETRKGVSDAVLKALYVNCSELNVKVVLLWH